MITQEQLLQVKELASLFFTVEQISLLTRIDKELLKRDNFWLRRIKSGILVREVGTREGY